MANWLYNGIEHPELPKHEQPYAFICNTPFYVSAYFLPSIEFGYNPGRPDEPSWSVMLPNGTQFAKTNREKTEWGNVEADTGQAFTISNIHWANFDVLNEDGTVYLAASAPIRVDSNLAISVEASVVTFTCSNLNTTDSVYKIAAWCYPKGTSVQNAPHTYVSADYFHGAEHEETWALSGLTAGVEYELYACILANDVATDHNALVTFTADEGLDFSNAALSLQMGRVQHNSYTFKLAYSGLPYNADGTSAVFDIVGVTGAGDKAVMGGKASSGSGSVNGTFMYLEPMTDYKATFEVYYNGQPTGVAATVSFSTEEEYRGGGYDRDSFLLGFASGLGATAATKDGAEYNSWAQGYIVGSALRKAL